MKRIAVPVITLVAFLAISGCASAEDRAAQEAAEKDRLAQQKWEALGNEGEAPRMDQAATTETVSLIYDVTSSLLINGSSDLGCEALNEQHTNLTVVDLDDEEQQGYVEALKADLGQAASGCEDGDWRDAMEWVIKSNAIAEKYLELYS